MDHVVAATIDRLRPAIEADGGTIELRSVDDDGGVVRIALTGACEGCTTSTGTLRAGIARIIRDHAPDVREVVNVADPGEVAETPVVL